MLLLLLVPMSAWQHQLVSLDTMILPTAVLPCTYCHMTNTAPCDVYAAVVV